MLESVGQPIAASFRCIAEQATKFRRAPGRAFGEPFIDSLLDFRRDFDDERELSVGGESDFHVASFLRMAGREGQRERAARMNAAATWGTMAFPNPLIAPAAEY